MSSKRGVVAAVNLAMVLERGSEQVLPAVYAYVARSFQSSLPMLGMLTLARSLCQALGSPLAGLAGSHGHRGLLIGIGASLWALCAAVFASASSLAVAFPAWSVAGFGLSLIVPNAQSLAADLHSPHQRGRAFGMLHLSSSLGGVIGGLVATNVAAVSSWRLAFFAAAAVAVLVGALSVTVVIEPTHTEQECDEEPAAVTLKSEAASLLRTPTFLIIVAQGAFGNMPWVALGYLTLYFQLLGLTALAASSLVAIFQGGVALGGLLGGVIGDAAATRWPMHGRIVVAQTSVAAGIPFALILFVGMHGGPSFVGYAAVMSLFSVIKAWPAPACNNPVFAEIVPPQRRPLIYAFDRCFETALASATAPLVGFLAQRGFGFVGPAAPTGDPAVDLTNAAALAKSLLLLTSVPWGIVLLLYTGLHWSYRKDLRRGALPSDDPGAEQMRVPSGESPWETVRRQVGSRNLQDSEGEEEVLLVSSSPRTTLQWGGPAGSSANQATGLSVEVL